MKRAILVWVVVVLAAATAFSQDTPSNSVLGGNLAINYGNWYVPSTNAVAAGSGQVMNFTTASCSVLVGNKAIFPFSTNAPLTISDGANTETVTPSAVYIDGSICNITATFANAHGAGIRVTSGTHGLQEAINDSTGATSTVWVTARSGVTSTIILAAAGRTNVGIIDVSGPQQHTYQFTGSSYTEISSGAGPINAGSSTGADLSAQITSTEAGPQCVSTGCPIGVAPGNYSLSTDFQVGNSTSKIPVNLFVQPGAKITVNTSDGSNPICIADGSSISGWGGVAGTGFGQSSRFALGSSASITNFFQGCSQTGNTQGMRMSGLNIKGAAGATVTGAMVDFKGNFSGSGAQNLTINGFNSGYGLRIWADSATTVGATVLGFYDIVVAGLNGNTSGKPVISFQASTSGGKIVEDVTGTNMSAENCSAGQPCLEFDGHASGNADFRLFSNNVRGLHIESGAQATSDGIKVADTHSLYLDSISFSDPGNRAIYAYETFLQTVTNLHFMGSNSAWPVTWQNWVNAQGFSTLNGSVSAGASSLTFNAATNLLPGSPIEIRDGASTEFVTTASTYTAGSTTVAISGTLANNHNNAVAVFWNPEEYSGPGPAGINNILSANIGSIVRDTNGVVDFTATHIHTLYQGERVFLWEATADATLNGVYQVNVGAQCVDGGGTSGACLNTQFEYQSATHSSFTSTLADSAYYATVRNYDIHVAGDDTVDGYKNRIPVISDPTRFDAGINPDSIAVYGFRVGAQGTPQYSRLFMGQPDPLRSQQQPTGMTASDYYIGTDYNIVATQGFTLPAFHLGTFQNQKVCLMQNGVDIACATTDGNLTMQGGAQLVGNATSASSVAPVYDSVNCGATCLNQNATIALTTMVATGSIPSNGAAYEFEANCSQVDVGVGCTGNATLTVQIKYTDKDASYLNNNSMSGTTWAAVTPTFTCTLTNGTIAQANIWKSYPWFVSASNATAIQFGTVYTNASGCSTQPHYSIRPVLRLLNNY